MAPKVVKNTKSKDTKSSDGKKVVSPASDEVLSMAKSLLLNHPEVINNAKHLFHNENGSTIIEEAVVRGDKAPARVITQYDITEDDINKLIKSASSGVDEVLLKYDPVVAYEDALTKAVYSSEEGLYAGKVNASTYSLMLESLLKPKTSKKASEEDSEDGLTEKQEAHIKRMEKGNVTGLGEGLTRPQADKILEERKKENVEDSDEVAKAPEVTETEEESTEDKPEDKKMDKKSAEERLAAIDAERAAILSAMEQEKAEEKLASTEDIIKALEVVASDLESEGNPELFKIAFQIDSICDVLEGKEGATISGDPDESYMKKLFKGDVLESDSDEKYMKEYMQGDDTVGVEKMFKKASVQPPYQIKR